MTEELPGNVALMDGADALPRDNGELVFSAPWEARALALAVALVERLDLPWDAFRRHLIDAVAADPDRPYYESWTVALEALVVEIGISNADAIDAAQPAERAPL